MSSCSRCNRGCNRCCQNRCNSFGRNNCGFGNCFGGFGGGFNFIWIILLFFGFGWGGFFW